MIQSQHPPSSTEEVKANCYLYLLAREAEISFAAFNTAQEVNDWARNEAGKK